jgi:hypothetical protein
VHILGDKEILEGVDPSCLLSRRPARGKNPSPEEDSDVEDKEAEASKNALVPTPGAKDRTYQFFLTAKS